MTTPATRPQNEPDRTALLVVGMHRSGTSAFARVCALLGAALPEHLLGARRGNATGHWEPERLVALHDEMLGEAGTRWDDWRAFDPSELSTDRRAYYETAILELIDAEYGSAPLFVLKDPRISRFLPFYRSLLESRGIATRTLIVLRSPAAVIRSLQDRDGMSSNYTGLMWLRYLLDAELGSRGGSRVFVDYREFLDDWRETMSGVGRALDVTFPVDMDAAAPEIEEFLSPELQHHAADVEVLTIDEEVDRFLNSTSRALHSLKRGEPAETTHADLDEARAFLDAGNTIPARATFAEMVVRQRRAVFAEARLGRTSEALVADLNAATRERDRLAVEVDRLHIARAAWANAGAQTVGFVRRRLAPEQMLRPSDAARRARMMWELRRTPELMRLRPDVVQRVRDSFDEEFYRDQYPDVITSGADPFVHYMRHGWREGRDPSYAFSTAYYLDHNPDVVEAGVNPLVHWILFGEHEQRPVVPLRRRRQFTADTEPLVSVVVPNYNHGRYLAQRLDSILQQTYKKIELIILDDASSDDSRQVIEAYRARDPDLIRVILNEVNSGSVFRQWRTGLETARGEIVWICESDDFCEPEFLAKLIPFFSDPSVNIAFGRIQFANEKGERQEGLDAYRQSAEPGIWNAPVVRPANSWFANGFGVTNVIANVGGCVFRRQLIAASAWDEALTYRTLGDWFLYVCLAGGGQIAYHPEAVAYFRQHDSNSSVAASSQPQYYVEHERFMRFLRETWDVPDRTVEAFYQRVARQYAHRELEPRLGDLSAYCDRSKLLATKRSRPHVLIGALGFTWGGGEVFPIDLANALREQGMVVSLFVVSAADAVPEVRHILAPGIAVYDAELVSDYGVDAFLVDAGVSVIHSHMVSVEGFFFGSRGMQKVSVPYLVTLHGSYEASELSPERVRELAGRVTHFVWTAEKNLAPLRDLHIPDSKFTRLGNARPVDERPFEKSAADLGIPDDAVVFTLVSRGIQRKGWRAAIEAFHGLRDRRPDVPMYLLLVGEGEQTDSMLAIHHADPNIVFLGYQQRVHGLLRMSDVALQPTRYAGESYPLILIDALLTGTPVISTRIGSIPEMLETADGAAGILIENLRDTPTFIRCLEDAMEAMLSTEARATYAAVARELGRQYDIGAVAHSYQRIYLDVVRAHNGES